MKYNEHKFIFYKLLFIIVIFFFVSCKYNPKNISEKVNFVMQNSQEGVTTIVDMFKSAKVIFIGMPDHSLINAKLFLNQQNLSCFYDVGVRYVLVEGGIDDGPIYNDEQLQRKWIELFFPWERVGAVYGPKSIGEIIFSINNFHNDLNYFDGRMTLVGLESKRQEFLSGQFTEEYIFNYRDSYMAENAIEFIDSVSDDIKVLIIAGNYHGITKEQEMHLQTSFKGKPLGAFLKQRYKDKFKSICYTVLDHDIVQNEYWNNLLFSPYWKRIIISTRYTSVRDMENLYKLIPFQFYREFDGYLTDVHSNRGILYSYKLDRGEVFSAIKKQLFDFNEKFKSNVMDIDYDDPFVVYDIDSFMRNVYFMKLFYGNEFNYTLYNPKVPLREALDDCKLPPKSLFLSDEELKEYISLMHSFTNIQNVDSKRTAQNLLKIYKKDYEKLLILFPQEPWALYWLAFMYYKSEEWDKAIYYYKLFFNNPLASSTQLYIEALNSIIICERNRGDNLASDHYMKLRESCINEFDIDFSKVDLFL